MPVSCARMKQSSHLVAHIHFFFSQEGERKLYLVIEGKSQQSVNKAKDEIKRILREEIEAEVSGI